MASTSEKLKGGGACEGLQEFFKKQKYNKPYYKAKLNKTVIFVSHNG